MQENWLLTLDSRFGAGCYGESVTQVEVLFMARHSLCLGTLNFDAQGEVPALQLLAHLLPSRFPPLTGIAQDFPAPLMEHLYDPLAGALAVPKPSHHPGLGTWEGDKQGLVRPYGELISE